MSEDNKFQEERFERGIHQNDWDWSMRGSNSWIWGLLLVLGGGILLVQELYEEIQIINAGNWWVIFILVPGFNMISRGWRMFRRTGRVWGPLIWGLLLVGFGFSQLFDYPGGEYVWPVMIIIAGLALLLGGGKR